MNTGAKIAGTAGAVGVIFGTYYLANLKNTGDKIVLKTKPTVSKGVVYVDVTVQNPSQTSLKISHPFVKVYKSAEDVKINEPFLSSQVESQIHTIQPSAETPFRIRIGGITEIITAVATSAISIIKDIIKGGLKNMKEVKIYLVTELTVNGRIPYKTQDEFTISPPPKK
ncbi:hypothetical protein [Bernardetia sp. MNP-M8]|uniref:hypothetical protein n=1 Tax=Bernardetia sp. MNP-M8 TaxID=3127470 RepID=UPI0030D51AB8